MTPFFCILLFWSHLIFSREPRIPPTPAPTLSYTELNHCAVKFDTVDTSFNLCPLSISSDLGGQLKYYKVDDSRRVNTTSTIGQSQYSYYFNVADNIPSVGVPPICRNSTHRYCPTGAECKDDTNLVTITGESYAYQVRLDESGQHEYCWALSNSDSSPEWSLIEEEDPSLGVQLTYINGDFDGSTCNGNRKFNIKFECEDKILFIPNTEPLYEYNPCEYTLTVPSQYGCPIECNIYDDQLCSSNGLCAFDRTNNGPRCYCFDKYDGDDCSLYNESEGIPEESAKIPEPSLYTYEFKDALGTGVDVWYDLNEFKNTANKQGGIFNVHPRSGSDRNYEYFVAISALINPKTSDFLPSFCQNILGPCTKFNGSECIDYSTNYNMPGLVYQVNNETKECYLLGSIDLPDSPSAVLYDQIGGDPARGLTVTYSKGAWCDVAKKNREFRMNLICPRDHSSVYDPSEETTIEDLYEYVEEEEICVYSFSKTTAVACPYQCITNTTDDQNKEAFTVCSTNGICAADPNAGIVRCLCDDGWTGAYCDEIDSKSPTVSPTEPSLPEPIVKKEKTNGRLIVVIVILVIVVLTVMIGSFYVYKNQRLTISQQADELDFQRMSDKGNSPHGMLSQDMVQTDVVVDNKTGKRGFATIGNQDDEEEEESDLTR